MCVPDLSLCTDALTHQKTIAQSSWSVCILSSFLVSQLKEEVLVINFIVYSSLQFTDVHIHDFYIQTLNQKKTQ